MLNAWDRVTRNANLHPDCIYITTETEFDGQDRPTIRIPVITVVDSAVFLVKEPAIRFGIPRLATI